MQTDLVRIFPHCEKNSTTYSPFIQIVFVVVAKEMKSEGVSLVYASRFFVAKLALQMFWFGPELLFNLLKFFLIGLVFFRRRGAWSWNHFAILNKAFNTPRSLCNISYVFPQIPISTFWT